MRREDRYMICTVKELAAYLVNTIRHEFNWTIDDVDFCTLGEDDTGESLITLSGRAWSWYGIKQVYCDGFDSDDLEIAGNHYGGGSLCATDTQVEEGFDREAAGLKIEELIIKALEADNAKSDTLLFVDLITERSE